MTLLRDIQDAAVGTKEPITNLLRRCKILAARLSSAEFARWVDLELNGYDHKDGLPSYRVLPVRSLGHFSGPFGSGLKNAPIPSVCIPEKYREVVTTAYAMQAISAYEDLLRKPDAGSFEAPWPADVTALFGQKIYQNMNCISAWQEIPRGAIVELLDTVRNRILSFALDIEKLSPNAGESVSGDLPIANDKVHQVFHTTIYGNVGNVATGSSQSQQTVGALVTQGDYSSLAEQLGSLGISNEDVEELKTALAEDKKEAKPGIGKRVGRWVGRMIAKAGEGAIKVSVETASSVLPKLILGYLGLPQ